MIASSKSDDECATALSIPTELQSLTERVVRRTRLWPNEKRDVRAELESHFREGLIDLLQHGMSLEQCVKVLREEFGDEAIVAQLIRRGKKRGRPMIWKMFKWGLVSFVSLVCVTGAYAAWLTWGKPSPSVDYIAKLNEPVLAIPEDQRAWPLLREAVLNFKTIPTELDAVYKKTGHLPYPGEEGWDQAVEWVRMNESIIPMVQEAVERPHYGYIYGNVEHYRFMSEYAARRQANQGMEDYEQELAKAQDDATVGKIQSLISIKLPSLADFRSIARMSVLDSRIKANDRQLTEAWNSLDVGYGLGTKLLDGFTIIEQLVGVAIMSLETKEMRSFLYEHGDQLTDSDWKTVLSSRIMTFPVEKIQPRLDGERMFFEDTVQFVFTDNGHGNGHIIPEAFLAFSSGTNTQKQDDSPVNFLSVAALHADRKETLRKFNELWDQTEALRSLPLYDPQRAEAFRPIEDLAAHPVLNKRYAMIALMAPNLNRADESFRIAAMHHQATQAVIALLRYRQDHKQYPGSLQELAPQYLPSIPLDIYSGNPLIYRVDESGQFTLYSIWRDFADDGGSSEMHIPPGSDMKMPKDMVYWPVEKEN